MAAACALLSASLLFTGLHAQTVIYSADFETSESYSTGTLHGQNGWTVPQGTVAVVAGANFSGSQGVTLATGSPLSQLGRAFSQFSSTSVVFIDFYAKPTAHTTAADSTQFDAESSSARFVKIGAAGEVFVLDGDGSGGGSWVATGKTLAINGSGEASDWVRFTFRQDYTAKTWDLYVNGAMTAHGLGFKDDTKTALTQFATQGGSGGTTAFDYFYAANVNPLFTDTDLDGLPDDWEQRWFGTLGHGPADDPGGVSRTIVASYQQNLSPWPAPLVASGLRFWARADHGVIKNGSNAVSQWTDISGTGAHVTGAGTTTWIASAMNGQPAVQFPGWDPLASATANVQDGGANVTVFAVIETNENALQSGATVVGLGDHTAGSGYALKHVNSTGWNRFNLLWASSGSNNNGNVTGIHVGSGIRQVLSFVRNGTAHRGYQEGILRLDASVTSDPIVSSAAVLTVGAGFGGRIAELLVYNRALSDSEREQIEQQLTARYDLVPAPPLIAINTPTNTAFFEQTDPVSISVSATAPGGTVTSVEFFNGVTKLGDGSLVPGHPTTYELVLPPGTTAGTYALTAKITDSNTNTTTTPGRIFTILPTLPTPTVASGLRVWLRADQGVVKDGSNAVTQWADRSGNHFHVSGTGPSWVASGLNSQPAVEFNGSSVLSSATSDVQDGGANVTVFAVVQSNSNMQDVSTVLNFGNHGGGAGGYALKHMNLAGWFRFNLLWATSGANTNGGPDGIYIGETPQVISYVRNGANHKGYRSGALDLSATVTGDAISAPPAVLEIGASFGGRIAELLVYNRALNDTERGQVEQALISRYITGTGDDTDSDTLPDTWEQTHFGSLAQTAGGDPDNDGLTNLQEYQAGTDPNAADSDADGLPDGWEVGYGFNPLSANGSGDPDSDGLTNLQEYQLGRNPTEGVVSDTGGAVNLRLYTPNL